MSELRPCPLCHSKDVKMESDFWQFGWKWSWVIRCKNCNIQKQSRYVDVEEDKPGLLEPEYSNKIDIARRKLDVKKEELKREAIAAWNKREGE